MVSNWVVIGYLGVGCVWVEYGLFTSRHPPVKFRSPEVPFVPAPEVLRLHLLPPILWIRQRDREPRGKVALEVNRQQRPVFDRETDAGHQVRVVWSVLSVESRGFADGLIVEGREGRVAERAEPPRT